MSWSSSATDKRSFPRSRTSKSAFFFSRNAFALRHVVQFGLCRNLIFDFAMFRSHSLETKVHRHGKSVFPDSQTVRAGIAQLLHIMGTRRNLRDPVFDPALETIQFTRLVVIFVEESMVAAIVTLDGRRMRAPGLVYDRRNQETRDERAVWVRSNHLGGNNFFSDDNHFARRAHSVNRDTQIPPQVGVASSVGPLDMQDRHVRTQCANGDEALFVHGGRKLAQITMALEKIAAER